ncbi:hypothetical protein ACVWWD_001820 [Mesorhizobium sp. URHB0026]
MSKKGYWLVMLTVTDPEGYQRYRDAIGDAVSSFGGRYLVRGGQVTNPEGRNLTGRWWSSSTLMKPRSAAIDPQPTRQRCRTGWRLRADISRSSRVPE